MVSNFGLGPEVLMKILESKIPGFGSLASKQNG